MTTPYEDYIGAPDETAFDQAFDQIGKALQKKNAQFLFGAGMSQSVGFPNGTALAKILLRDYFPDGGATPLTDDRLVDLVREFPFEATVGVLESLPGARTELTATLKRIYLDPARKPGKAHEDFASLCLSGGSPRLRSIFTTNFDHLLEDVLGPSLAISITEDNAAKIREVQQSAQIPVIHLHGLLTKDDVVQNKYQLTERDLYDQTYRVLNYEFETELHYSDAFVFVGYSMSDPDFRDIYLKYRSRIAVRERMAKKTFVVSKVQDRFSYTLGKEIWKSRNAVLLPFTAETFFELLKEHMSRKSDKGLRKDVMAKFGIDEAGLDEKIERYAAKMKISPEEALAFLNNAPSKGGASHE